MHRPLRTAVIGLGYFGRFHARHHALNDNVKLVAVCDADGARAGEIAAEFGGEAVTDHRSLAGRIDAASVAVPTSMHFDVARDLIEAGIHVLIEKPITHDTASADALIDLARARTVTVQIGHIERYSAAYKALAAAATAPRLIKARRISPWKPRATDVDVVLDLMIHDIDLAMGLAGAPVVAVEAVGMPVISASEDYANARLTFANGVVAELTASRVAERVKRVTTVFQDDGYLVCDLGKSRLTRFSCRPGATATDEDALAVEARDIPREDGLANEIAEFVASIRAGRAPAVDGQAGADALQIATMITDDIRARRDAGQPAAESARRRDGEKVAWQA